jgi:uncharacterized membrane protein YhaH (DUF805 family)
VNDSAATWYYTREGKQNGPVTLAELKGFATAGTLNPRHDMVWQQGMTDWRPAGEVDGIFEKRVVAETSAPAAPAPSGPAQPAVLNPDPYAPPAEIGVDSDALQHAAWPGARRRSYILMAMVVPIIWQFGFALAVPMAGVDGGAMALVFLAASLVVMVLAIWFGVQRLANVGMSRWWYLGNIVPILNLWIGYRMLACPAGYAYHKKLDGPGIALAILYWLFVALIVLVVVAAVVLGVGMASNPELQQQIEQIIRANSASGQ